MTNNVIPEKWCIRGTEKNSKILEKFFSNYKEWERWEYGYGYFYIENDIVRRSLVGRVFGRFFCFISNNIKYQEISFEDFETYILNEQSFLSNKINYDYLIPILEKLKII